MGRLNQKVAFVTGAARGQGRAEAVTLAREGADIIAVDIDGSIDTVNYKLGTPEELAETARLVEEQDQRVITVAADIRSQSALDDAVERGIAEFGKIDILIANAGILSIGRFWELAEDEWDDMIAVNLTGAWKTTKAVIPHMIERKSGSIVMTASMNAFESGTRWAHYTAAKHGVLGLMRSAAQELAPYGIRVNCVCPGTVDTGMMEGKDMWNLFSGDGSGKKDDYYELAGTYHALAGHGSLPPQVIADAVLWLVSDEASAVTGVAVPVDAGHLILPRVNQSPVS